MGDSWASQTAPRLPCPVVSVQRHFGRLSHSGHSPNPLASLGPAHPLGLRTCHQSRYAGQRGATLTAVGSVVPLSINNPGASGPGGVRRHTPHQATKLGEAAGACSEIYLGKLTPLRVRIALPPCLSAQKPPAGPTPRTGKTQNSYLPIPYPLSSTDRAHSPSWDV